jgi:hypothetical protein
MSGSVRCISVAAVSSLLLALVVPPRMPAGAQPPTGVSVVTQHNDNARTGANLHETLLTPALVGQRGMRRIDRLVDGWTYGQVLYAHGVAAGGKPRNVAYVVTSRNSVYAYDVDAMVADPDPWDVQGGLLWRRTLVDPLPGSGRMYARGINSTPVIGTSPNGTHWLYVMFSTMNEPVGQSSDVASELELQKKFSAAYYFVKLDLGTGAMEHTPVALTGSVKRTDGAVVPFDARNENDNPSLLLDHGYLYASFGQRMHENASQYYGWVLRYTADDLKPSGAFNVSPYVWKWPYADDPVLNRTANCYYPRNGRLKPWGPWVANGGKGMLECISEGGGIWQGGAGPAADAEGNVYVATGNGHYDPRQPEPSYANAVVKLTSTASTFALASSFAPATHRKDLEDYDVDLGSAGPLVVDGAHSVIMGGKTGIFYVLDSGKSAGSKLPQRDEIVGGYNRYEPSRDQSEYDRYKSWNFGPHFHGSPTMWRFSDTTAWIYEWAEKDTLKKYAFDLTTGRFVKGAHPWVAQGDVGATNCGVAFLLCIDAMPGGMLALSANGRDRSSGIVWAILRGGAHDMDAPGPMPSGMQSPVPAGDSLYAFDAQSLRRLWSQPIWSVPRFAGPTVADGRVLVPSNFWVFSVYVLNDAPAAKNGTASRAAAVTAAAASTAPVPPVPAWGAMTMDTRPVASYDADPMFRARQALPSLLAKRDPGGVIPGSQYVAIGTEHYACPPPSPGAACAWTRTEATLTPLAIAPGHAAAALGAAASAPASVTIDAHDYRVATFPWPRAAGWQVIESGTATLNGPFANAVYVLRTMTVNGAPPTTWPAPGDVAVPFTALYSAFVQGK